MTEIRNIEIKQAGFSFVELMISVAIIGIVAAIAIPTYLGYVGTARQARVEAELMQIPILLEQYRAENMTGELCPAPPCNGDVYTEKTGTTEISAFLTSYNPTLAQNGVNYEYRITFTANDQASLKAILTGDVSDNVTCTFPDGQCN